MTPTSEAVSARMRRQRTAGTAPEMAVRRACHAAGLRYRVDHPLPPAPRRRGDLVFTRARVAVMVDGCFWHGCPDHGRPPRANAGWWSEKLARNRARDADTDRLLAAAGWTVVRAWEHDDPMDAAARVLAAVRGAP